MDALAAAQDEVLERLEKAGVQGDCGPKLNPKADGRVLVREGREGRQHRAAAQARQREAEGRDDRLRHADQVVAGDAAEAGRGEVSCRHRHGRAERERSSLSMPARIQKTKAGSDPGLFLSSLRASEAQAIHSRHRWIWIPASSLALLAMTARESPTPPLASPPASDNPCSPWRRRRRTSPCRSSFSGAPFFRRSTRSGLEMNGLPNAIRSAASAVEHLGRRARNHSRCWRYRRRLKRLRRRA